MEPNSFTFRPEECVHFAIDIQSSLCQEGGERNYGNLWTEVMADKVAEVAPRISAAGVPTVWVHGNFETWGPLHKVKSAPTDELHEKKSNDAFGSIFRDAEIVDSYNEVKELTRTGAIGNLDLLEADQFAMCRKADEWLAQGRKILLITGVNLNACITSSCRSALAFGFKPVIMWDCVAQGGINRSPHDRDMIAARKGLEDEGVVFVESAEVLRQFEATFRKPPTRLPTPSP